VFPRRHTPVAVHEAEPAPAIEAKNEVKNETPPPRDLGEIVSGCSKHVVMSTHGRASSTRAHTRDRLKFFRTDHSTGSSWSAPGAQSLVTYVTKNGCDLYLSSTRDGAERIYWAKRTPIAQ
jgi:hypothetical protein